MLSAKPLSRSYAKRTVKKYQCSVTVEYVGSIWVWSHSSNWKIPALGQCRHSSLASVGSTLEGNNSSYHMTRRGWNSLFLREKSFLDRKISNRTIRINEGVYRKGQQIKENTLFHSSGALEHIIELRVNFSLMKCIMNSLIIRNSNIWECIEAKTQHFHR